MDDKEKCSLLSFDTTLTWFAPLRMTRCLPESKIMKHYTFLALISLLTLTSFTFIHCKKQKPIVAKTSFYDLKAKDVHGKEISMSRFKGKTIIIVSTASKCGYAGQLTELEELYQEFKKDLIVLGFPTNDFWGQEPKSNKEIAQMCSRKKVTFPMFSKITTQGNEMSTLYDWLTDKNKNGWNKKKPGWNFNKYIIDKKGNLVAHFGAGTSPKSKKIKSLIL